MVSTIVIPLHHRGGKFKDDTELRYTLRSIAVNFRGEYRIVIAGKKLPEWAAGLEHIQEGGLKKALRRAADRFPAGFFWWYDDCTLLLPQTPEELRITPGNPKLSASSSDWGKKLGLVKARLEKEGITPRDYSHPHGPYWFTKAMIDDAFARWPDMKGKFPVESDILSVYQWPFRKGVVAQRYGAFGSPPAPDKVFLNYSGEGTTPGLLRWLSDRFPDPSPFEADEVPPVGLTRPPPLFLIHIPKTGGTSIRSALGMKVGFQGTSHFHSNDPPALRFKRENPDGIMFAVVRNPYDRAWSIYRFFRRKKKGGRGGAMDVAMEAFCQGLTVDEFWQKVDITRLQQACPHVRTQTHFIRGGRMKLLRFENLDADWNALRKEAGHPPLDLPRLQKTPTATGWREALSAETKRRIERIYRDDFLRFNYPIESHEENAVHVG